MPEPLVSVKMITYNHAPFIAQAIDGVLMQKTNFPFELVIGEDCSTDGTREIVFEYQKKYPDIIRIITSDNNVGGKKNSYRTRKACRGKYIAFCEGDDYWHHPQKLQKQADYMEGHPECGLAFADFNVYLVKDKKCIPSVNYHEGFQMPMNLTIEQIICGRLIRATCTAVIRKELYNKIIEGDPYLHQGDNFLMGDTQIWAEMSVISKVTYIPETLATYNKLDESASRSNNPIKGWRFMKSSQDLRLYLIDKYNLAEDIRNSIEAAWCNATLRLAFHSRNLTLADEVKMRKKIFTWKERLRYYGAKHAVWYYVYHSAAFIPNLFRKKREVWL